MKYKNRQTIAKFVQVLLIDNSNGNFDDILFDNLVESLFGPNQCCSKTTKLQDQDHLFFQDQDRFFEDHQIINPRPLA